MRNADPPRHDDHGETEQLTASVVRPRLTIIFVAAWAIIQVVRISGLSVAQGVLAGHDSPAWLYPGLVDTFLAVTAPFVAFALWRRTGLTIWVTAIAWFIVSVVDHLDGLTAALTTPLPTAFRSSPPMVAIAFLLLSSIDLTAVALLARRSMRSHYLGPPRSGG